MIPIRQADETDIQALYGLMNTLGYHKEDDYFEQCLSEGERQVYIVMREGRDVGYCILNWQPKYALYKKLGIPEIQDLNVIPEARRRGAATALIEHCENLARERACEHIGISVGLYSDYGPAQRLYAKLGYVPDGNGVTYDRQPVAPGEIRPVDDDLCLMMVKSL